VVVGKVGPIHDVLHGVELELVVMGMVVVPIHDVLRGVVGKLEVERNVRDALLGVVLGIHVLH
jgi:prephenate dehydratase